MSSKPCSGFVSILYQKLTKKHLPFASCCIIHDDDYSANGVVTRKLADEKLAWCVAASGYPKSAKAMYIGVRLLGWLRYRR